MEIYFKTKKLARECNRRKDAVSRYGADMAGKLGQRLMELRAADSLADISRIPPPRCHELKGKRKGQLSVDLVHPYRLLFIPDHDPFPEKPDGGLDWTQVTEILIIGIEDTH